MGVASKAHDTMRPVLWRLTRPASVSTARCFIAAGSDILSGAASSLTDSASFPLSRASMPRRVPSDSAEKMRSSLASEYLTIRFSLEARAYPVKPGFPAWNQAVARVPTPNTCAANCG